MPFSNLSMQHPLAFATPVPLSSTKSNPSPYHRCTSRRTNLIATSSLSSSSPSTQSPTYFATCPRGLGQVLAQELVSAPINAHILSVASSGVSFTHAADQQANSNQSIQENPIQDHAKQDHSVALRACLWLRTAIRVLYHLQTTELESEDLFSAVYQAVKHATDWSYLLQNGRTFSVLVKLSQPSTSVNAPYISEQTIQISVKNAICDALSDANIPKPPPPLSHASADLPLFITIHRNQIALYLDMAGASLHKRGYRDSALHKSPLNESVAAAMLYLGGFQPDGTLLSTADNNNIIDAPTIVDPMCGSATLLIEAALLRLRVAPGLYRPGFAFQNWPQYDHDLYQELVQEAISLQRPDKDMDMTLLGSDNHGGAIAIARRDIENTRLSNLIHVQQADIRDVKLRHAPTMTVCNPPWGMRIDEQNAWEELGYFLKDNVQDGGSSAVIICGDAKLTRALRLRARRKFPVRIGNVDTRVLIYDMLSKSERETMQETYAKNRDKAQQAGEERQGKAEKAREWQPPIF